MSKIINGVKVVRRNWKKSIFFFGVAAYGSSYFVDRYKTFQMMRAYCEEAKKYGEKTLPTMTKPAHVTVILNPEANDRKCNAQFEKFAAPLLHLAGFKVSIFKTERGRQAEDLMQVMSNTDAVIVAGGNGTLQEVVTGLLRRPDMEEPNLPLGIIPLGKTNTVAKYLFGSKSSSRPQLMAEAVMAIIREKKVNLDCLKIKFETEEQPVFGMCSFEEGVFADVEPLVPKYWYLGILKDKYTYIKNSFKSWQPIMNEKVEYIAPCSGCSKCYSPTKRKAHTEQSTRWWQVFVPRKTETAVKATEDFSKVVNEDCGTPIALPSEYSNMSVLTTAAGNLSTNKAPTLKVKTYPKYLSIWQFVSSGLSHRKSEHEDTNSLANIAEARQVTIQIPTSTEIATQIESASVASSPNKSSEEIPESLDKLVNLSRSDSVPQTLSDSSELESREETPSLDKNNNKPENLSSDKDAQSVKEFSYIDKEKWPRSSCIISILPKHVTIYA